VSRQQELVERIGRLSPRKQALLQARLDGLQGGSAHQSSRLALAAFVTPASDQVPSADQLRESLRRLLPEYMVPTSFTILDDFPLLPNRKVDVAALSVSKKPAVRQSPARAIIGDTENQLIDIWGEVLQTDYIDVEDNFFEMGGDSILGMMMVSRAHNAGLALEIGDLFDNPTIAQLATQLLEREMEGDRSQV